MIFTILPEDSLRSILEGHGIVEDSPFGLTGITAFTFTGRRE
jgi:hypothetical protein